MHNDPRMCRGCLHDCQHNIDLKLRSAIKLLAVLQNIITFFMIKVCSLGIHDCQYLALQGVWLTLLFND